MLSSCDQEENLIKEKNTLFKKFYGTAFNEQSHDMLVLEDGSILLLGTTNVQGNGANDIYLVKTDAYGDELWGQTFGGPADDGGTSLSLDANGDVLITGFVTDSLSDKNFALFKVGADGSLLDSLTVGRKKIDEEGQQILATQDGGYLFGGDVKKDGEIIDNFFYKLNAAGDSLWTVSVNFLEGLGSLKSMIELDDGRVLWCSSADIGNTVGSSIVLGIIEPNGESNQLLLFGENNGTNELAYDLQKTNLGWVLVASTEQEEGNKDILLLGVNTSGQPSINWEKQLGTPQNEEAYNITSDPNGNFLIVGKQEVGSENEDMMLMNADFTGNINWIKNFGGEGNDIGSKVDVTADGDIIIMGTSEIENNNVLTLIRTDSEGEFSSID